MTLPGPGEYPRRYSVHCPDGDILSMVPGQTAFKYQRFPFESAASELISSTPWGVGKKLFDAPCMSIRPMEPFAWLTNHIAPSGPAVIQLGRSMPLPQATVLMAPVGVIRANPSSVENHKAPSGPATIPQGSRSLQP